MNAEPTAEQVEFLDDITKHWIAKGKTREEMEQSISEIILPEGQQMWLDAVERNLENA